MKPVLFDSHINLHGEQYDSDREEVLTRARELGVSRFISICDKLENFTVIRDLTEKHDDMWCSVGVHPHYAKDYSELDENELIKIAQDPKVCAVGESGLDLHYGYSDIDLQEKSFRKHISAARQSSLPIIIHSREADELMGNILEDEMTKGRFQPLMHCYTSGMQLAERAMKLDAYFSISGIISFKKADDVRAVALEMPLNRVILETDCPYLAPMPYRGRRNEPAYLLEVCRSFAELRGMTVEEMANLTTENCLRLFGRVK
ncbi:TatD family hydrolase [Hirschia litorea]|uniref:TatD family hydrolase n=1 Tax=Hirschia litorea TaxID=1199156 RepID=A0ABW2IHL9_9PROT